MLCPRFPDKVKYGILVCGISGSSFSSFVFALLKYIFIWLPDHIPIVAVPIAGLVTVNKNLISNDEITRIILLFDWEVILALEVINYSTDCVSVSLVLISQYFNPLLFAIRFFIYKVAYHKEPYFKKNPTSPKRGLNKTDN